MKKIISVLLVTVAIFSVFFVCEVPALPAFDVIDGNGVYENGKLTDITNYDCTVMNIKKGTTEIGSRAFEKMGSLTEINIPASVKKIPDAVFESCSGLLKINVEAGSKYFKSVDGVLFNKKGTKLIAYPANKKCKNYTVPSKVKEIAPRAFYRSNITGKIDLPSSVRTIGYFAFGSTKAEFVLLKDGVESIGAGAFWTDRTTLNRIFIPKSVKKFGNLPFGDGRGTGNRLFVVYGYSGSPVEEFCKKKDIDFVSVDIPAPSKTTVKGGKGKITINYKSSYDAARIQFKYSDGKTTKLIGGINGTKKYSRTISGLTAGKYTVKARTLRYYAGTTVYSPWTVRTVTVK